MKEDAPTSRKGAPRPARPPSRKLSLPSRVRAGIRRVADRILSADVVWSVAFAAVSLAVLSTGNTGHPFAELTPGELAPEDVLAPEDIEIASGLTNELREKASRAIPKVYVRDRERVNRPVRELRRVFREGHLAMDESVARPGENAAADPWLSLKQRVNPAALEILRRHRFSPALERSLADPLESVMSEPVVASKALMSHEAEILVVYVPDDRKPEKVSDFSAVLDLDKARERVLGEIGVSDEIEPAERSILGDWVAGLVDANLTYDPDETRSRRESAASDVPEVMLQYRKGQHLLRKGETVTREKTAALGEARLKLRRGFSTAEFVGLITVLSLLAFFLFRYSRYHQRHFHKVRNLHALMVLVLLGMLLLSRGMLSVASQLVDNWGPPFDDLNSYTFLIPLGGGAILVALLANGRIATVYSVFAGVLFGALTEWDLYRMLWALLVQLAGVYAISAYRERAALLWAGLVVGVVGAAVALATEALRGTLWPLGPSLYGAALAFLGGAVGVGLLISFALPLFERLFNVLTDIRLLELSNVNHPLLTQLAVTAPGSYNHSLVVGTLAQEAARVIEANSLFCGVAAFYHDIGKMQKPEYYVENQRGVNPHDRLSPSMSALIIAAHVKDGIRMAREAGLPEQIVAIIPQHHGTRIMSYFYEKAKKNADPSLGPVNEADFRYPGPKPQTAEAAIFMLADAVEAAARTVEDPAPNRLREMIRKVTNAIVLERQLDECDLTFSDLRRIQEAFLRTLVSMYHQRVDYPGFDFGKPRSVPAAGEAPERRAVRGS